MVGVHKRGDVLHAAAFLAAGGLDVATMLMNGDCEARDGPSRETGTATAHGLWRTSGMAAYESERARGGGWRASRATCHRASIPCRVAVALHARSLASSRRPARPFDDLYNRTSPAVHSVTRL